MVKKSCVTFALSGCLALVAVAANAQTLIVERTNQDPDVNIRNDGQVDRSIGRILGGNVEEAIEFRQRHYGDVTAHQMPGDVSQTYEQNAIANANAADLDFSGSALAKGKQRLRGTVDARLEARVQPSEPATAIEIKLNTSAFGNNVTLENVGTQIVDLRQRNDGPLVSATVVAEVPGEGERSLNSNAVALSNSFSSSGPISNFGGDIHQRSHADVVARNETSGARQNDTVQAVAVGNSISVSRK